MLKYLSHRLLDVAVVGLLWRLLFWSAQGPWLALWLVVSWAAWRSVFWTYHGFKMKTSGHLTPRPSIFARCFYGFMTRLLGRLAIGPIEVEGAENLPKHGRILLVPNHTYPPDFVVVRQATGLHTRFMTVTSELGGLRGVFGAWTGAIPVNTKVEGGGQAAVQAAVDGLVAGDNLLIFPQGKLVYDNVPRREDFKNGFARIAQAVKSRVQGKGAKVHAKLFGFRHVPVEPVYVVPMAIHYKRSEADKQKLGWLLKRTRKMFGQGYQYGAKAVIGKPIEVAQLPADPDKATDLIFEQICVLLPIAQGKTPAGK